jgi:hypothetical protein
MTVAVLSPFTAIFIFMSAFPEPAVVDIFMVTVPSNCAANGAAATSPIIFKAMIRRI